MLKHPYGPARASYRATSYPFTRAEIVRSVNSKKARRNWLAERREKMFPTPTLVRVANVKDIDDGVHVVGVGKVLQLTENELRIFLRGRGFTAMRRE